MGTGKIIYNDILLCIAQENGSGGYDIMYQYFIDEPQILSVTLVSQQNYKIYFIKRYGDKVNMQDGEMNVYNLTLTEDITIRAEVTAFPPINNSIIV